MNTRQAAYAQEALVDERGIHMVVLVDENQPGYSPSTYTGSLEYCMAVADSINEGFGLTAREAMDVVASSFASQQQMEDFLEGSGTRVTPLNGGASEA